MKKFLSVAAAVTFGLLANAVIAASPDSNPSGPYAGLGWGKFNLKLRGLDDVGRAVNSITDSDDTAWKAFVGYRFSPYIGVEAAYLDFGRPSDRFTATGSNGNYRVDLSGFAPYFIATAPLGPVEIFGKLGYYFYDVDTRIDFDAPGPDIDTSHSRSDFIYGGGVGITVLDHLHLRAEYERIDISHASDSDAFWLSAAWRF